MNKIKKITAGFLVMLILLMNVPMYSLGAETKVTEEELTTMIQDTSKAMKEVTGSEEKNVLADSVNVPAGNSVCDWAAIAWALSGEEEDYDTYLYNLEQYVSECYKTSGYIDDRKATETQRIALTVSILGGDPTSFGEDKEGNEINLVADGTYGFYKLSNANKEDAMSVLGTQGINGYIYALLLLDSNNYEIPAEETVTREAIVKALLDGQSEEGGFALGEGGDPDVDITAMALHALAVYKDQAEVQEAIDKAITWIGEQMTNYGAFEYNGEASSETSSQVILAMSALDIDITKEERLIKNGMTLLDGLNLFRLDDSSYMHTMTEGTANMMATEQALLALNALRKSMNGQGRLYDLSAYEAPTSAEAGGIIGQNGIFVGFLVAIAVAVVLIVGAVFITRRKK